MSVVPVRVGTGLQQEPNRPAFAPGTEHRSPQRCVAMTIHDIDRGTPIEEDFDGRGNLRLSSKMLSEQ